MSLVVLNLYDNHTHICWRLERPPRAGGILPVIILLSSNLLTLMLTKSIHIKQKINSVCHSLTMSAEVKDYPTDWGLFQLAGYSVTG